MVEIKTSEAGIIVENIVKLTPKQAEKLGNALIVDEILNFAKDQLNMVCMIRNPEVVLNLLLADSVNIDIISKAVETIVEASAKMRSFIKDLQIEQQAEQQEEESEEDIENKFNTIINAAEESIKNLLPDSKVCIVIVSKRKDGNKDGVVRSNIHPAILLPLIMDAYASNKDK